MSVANPRTVRLAPIDNVVMAIDPVEAGQVLENMAINVSGDVPAGHKIATSEIVIGGEITKFA